MIGQWDRESTLPVMSTSSGLKDYIHNRVWAYFQQHPLAAKVTMVRGRGQCFVIHQKANGSWYDCTERELRVDSAQQKDIVPHQEVGVERPAES